MWVTTMRHNYTVRPATEADAEFVGVLLRQADADEIKAASGREPVEGTVLSYRASRDPKVGCVDGVPVCIFGVAEQSLVSDRAVPWLLGTDDLPKHARAFLRMSRAYVQNMKREYRLLFNYVDARNTYAVRWLGWLGFKIEEPQPFGPERLPFHRFSMERENV